MLEQRTYNFFHTQTVSGLDQRTSFISLKTSLQNFLLSCKVDELSPFTTQSYQQKLTKLLDFLGGQNINKPNAVTASDIRLFLLHLQETCQKTAVGNNYRAIKRFFNWLVEEGILKTSPVATIRPPRKDEKVIQPFKQSHIKALLSLCDDRTFLGSRNKAIILVLLDTGLRLSELAGIHLNDLDFDQETIKVMGKGARERVVRIGKTSQKALLRYLLKRKDNYPCVWVTEEYRPLTRWGILLMISKLGKRLGFTDVRCSPHTFRHTSATQSLRNGAALEDVKNLLGHKTLYMTMRYAATINSEDAVLRHRKWSPVDNMYLR